MNTLVIVLIAAVVLFGAYMVYGRWLAKKWGIDPKAEINRRSRSCNRCYSGSSIWMVTSFTLDPHRWCILRSSYRLWCTLCFS